MVLNLVRLVRSLGARGYRVIAVQYPPYWTHYAWAEGFHDFVKVCRPICSCGLRSRHSDAPAQRMGLKKFHLFGASLGGRHRPVAADVFVVGSEIEWLLIAQVSWLCTTSRCIRTRSSR